MNVASMHNEFKVGVDKSDGLNAPAFEPEEIDIFLNDAQERFIAQRAYGANPRRKGLEETEKRRSDLKNITTNANIITSVSTADNKLNGAFYDLPPDYRFTIEEECTISYLDCKGVQSNKAVPIVPITHDRYNKIVRDPFNKPYEDKVLSLEYEVVNGLERKELITDGVITITAYHLRYLRTPLAIQYGTTYSTPTTDQDCELSDSTHKEIVKMAYTSALVNIGSQLAPINQQELNIIE